METQELIQFSSFAKGKTTQTARTKNAVIYTRVSTKEQADNNMSLETQKKACLQYAQRNGYAVLENFGGTFESAKTDERKHFNNMLTYVKKSKQKIALIIVYSVDRFSRSGANAIYIANQLKEQGINVHSVSQPTDATTASGSLQQNIQFIFSEYDNQLRREKCMAGVREKLLAGDWCCAPPIGYDIVRSNGVKKIVCNKIAPLIKKAFLWKANDLLNNVEIHKRLTAKGIKISHQRVCDIFINPFYCGLITHKSLNGTVVKGNQEQLISKELFLKVNGIVSQRKQGYRIKEENEEIPLKRFIKCETCGQHLRGYQAYKNKKYYYKCNTIGCNNNKRADALHDTFLQLISQYSITINSDIAYLIKQEIKALYHQITAETEQDRTTQIQHLAKLNNQIERLEERYIMEELDQEMFMKFKQKFVTERTQIEQEMANNTNRVSNLDQCIEMAIQFSTKLASMWTLGGYEAKQKLQYLVFPEGIVYNKKTDQCRTPRVNAVFSCLAALSTLSDKKITGNISVDEDVSRLVVRPGFEPRMTESKSVVLPLHHRTITL
jgi:site-specific DNA recombinase